MDAIETLMNEHRVIERVIDGLVAFTEEIERKGTTDRAELGRFVTFIREFADAGHHGKEEDILFAAMVGAGFPSQGGPIAVMLHEHDQGRALVAILRDQTGREGPWTDADRHEIAEAARGYADLLRAHIHKEDAILYPMAEQHLTPEALQAVSDACERYESQPGRAGRHAELHALADALVARYAGAAHPAPRTAPRLGCCG
jgi:hemerythrin-like domain-containing protein